MHAVFGAMVNMLSVVASTSSHSTHTKHIFLYVYTNMDWLELLRNVDFYVLSTRTNTHTQADAVTDEN